GFAVVLAFAATSVPKPTISSAPAGSTNQTSAAFTYTDRKAGVTFQCSLDGSAYAACGTTRPSSQSYPGPLSAGSHTFRVQALSGSSASAAAAYTWTIDTTPPTVSSINRGGSTPTNAASVTWKVVFN